MSSMALPTSVSFSSFKPDATEETPLLSVPTRSATFTTNEESQTKTATQLQTHAVLTLHPLTDIQEMKDASTSEDVLSPVKSVAEVASASRREVSISKGGEGLSLHVAVTADTSTSSLCTVTDTHRCPHASIVTSRVMSSAVKKTSLGQCCRELMAPASQLGGSVQSPNEAGVSSRKSSLEERLSRIWSTSTESNADCESENCDGSDLRCRKCGKIVSVSRNEESNALTGVNQILKGVISHYSSQSESLRRIQQQPQVVLSLADRQHRLQASKEHSSSATKQRNPHNYSTLFSTCSRNIKKRGNRRQSVDVIYAREPTEPDIEKIKSKRRLSRQTDVSSIELMTLNEGNEIEDAMGKELRSCKKTDTEDQQTPVATVQVQGENMRLSHCQLSPGGTRIHNLRTSNQNLTASSSTESCPRVPWNSLETNLSNQDMEEKYIINDTRSNPVTPQTFNLEHRSSMDQVEFDTDHEGGGTDREEQVSEEGAERTAKSGARSSSARQMQEDEHNGPVRPEQEAMIWQDWSAEAVVLVALLVYIACKVLTFVESVIPRHSRKKN